MEKKGGIFMEEDTLFLLQECEAGCAMAIDSIDQIQEYVENDKLACVIAKYREKHDRLKEEIHKILYRKKQKDKGPHPMAKAMSWISTEMKLMIQDDSSKIAEILADGCNMGIQSVAGYENQYKNASSESVRIADRLIRAEEDFAKDLREFM